MQNWGISMQAIHFLVNKHVSMSLVVKYNQVFDRILKNWFDVNMSSGFAYRYRKNSMIPHQYLRGKTARFFVTAGATRRGGQRETRREKGRKGRGGGRW